MTRKLTGKAAIAGAIGSAAIAAAMLYAGKRAEKRTDKRGAHNKPKQPGPIPSGEKPETD